MKKLTIKDLLDKILNFNLFSLRRCVRPIILLGLCLVVSYLLFHLGLYFKHQYEQMRIAEQEVEALASEKESYARLSVCYKKLEDARLSREDLEFYKAYNSCMKGRELTSHEIDLLEAAWSSPDARVENFFNSYYAPGQKPEYCKHYGGNKIKCNTGNMYLLKTW